MARKKKLLFSILIIIVAGACVAYYMYSKGPVDVKNSSGLKASAEDLYKTFYTDSATAKINYAGKIVEVSGEIMKASKNQQKNDVILLKTNSAGASVNCTMEQTSINIKEGDKVTVKGICSGIGQGDQDLGILGDVYLIRCYISQ